jgi:hypothetical protein
LKSEAEVAKKEQAKVMQTMQKEQEMKMKELQKE